MEVNDNPNLEHGIEDQVGKDESLDAAAALVRRTLRAVAFPGYAASARPIGPAWASRRASPILDAMRFREVP